MNVRKLRNKVALVEFYSYSVGLTACPENVGLAIKVLPFIKHRKKGNGTVWEIIEIVLNNFSYKFT